MAFEGTSDVWKCDDCGAIAHLPPGFDINRWPDWTNQTWTYYRYERDAKVRCPKCSRKAR